VISLENHHAEIRFDVYDSETLHYGGNQYWFKKKFHKLSGCGPVAAANITTYLSLTFPDKYSALYTYNSVINKKDFEEHMAQIRKYVRPGLMGLTSVRKFSDSVLAFSRERGVALFPHILEDNNASIEEAKDFISEALAQRLPVAILVLKHKVKEFEEYSWHWMTITDLRLKPEDNLDYIIVSTYGQRKEINLERLWNERRPKDLIRLVYLT
jgi:hypothetical protein